MDCGICPSPCASYRQCKSMLISDLSSSHKMCDVETPRHYFLRLLEKDYPESILCERCQKIHRPGHPELTRKPFGKSCSCRRDDYQTSSLYGPAFTFQKAQLAMKSHRAGLPRAASHLKRLSIMDKSSNEDLHGSLEAKIVNNRLYVKADYTRSIPIERVHHPIPFDIFLCHHMRISTVNYDNAFAVIERPITTCIVTLETPYIVQLVHQKYSCVTCPSCSTQAGLFFDENTSANQDQLTVKIWKDFGECLTPFDELWSSHCNKLSGSRKTYQRATIRSTPSNQMQEWDVKHDAMRAFEGETWRSALAHRGAVNLLSTSTTQNPPRDSQVGGGMERPNIFRELFRYMATLIRR